MNFATGGSDAQPRPWHVPNLVTKRGGAEWRGGVKGTYTSDSYQSSASSVSARPGQRSLRT